MGIRRLLVAAAVLGAAVVMAQTGPAQACSCAAWEEGSTQEEREAVATEHAHAVFVGEAGESRVDDPDGDPNTFSSGDRRDVTFSVRRAVKGPVTNPFVVSTARDGATCGVSFNPGTLYKVFTYEREGRYWAGLCGATRVATEADLVGPALPTAPPPPPTTTRPPPESTTTTAPPVTEPAPETTTSTTRPETDLEVALDSEPTSTSTPVGLSATAILLLLAVAGTTGLQTWRSRRS